MEAGEHLRMVEQYSDYVYIVLDALLQVDETKRATVRDILHFPGVIDEVTTFKASAEFHQQFSAAAKHITTDEYFQGIATKGVTFTKLNLVTNPRTAQYRAE